MLPGLANACADKLERQSSTISIKQVLEVMNLHMDACPEMKEHINAFIGKVKEDETLGSWCGVPRKFGTQSVYINTHGHQSSVSANA